MQEVTCTLIDKASWCFKEEEWLHDLTKCTLTITGTMKEMKLVRDEFNDLKKGPWTNTDLYQTIC